MVFNSFEFALFFPVVFFLYWFRFQKNLKAQNLFLLLASYFFYGWWDWRFLSLIFFSSLVDYLLGLEIHRTQEEKRRKLLVALSLTTNLGLLAVFKYFNFFVGSFVELFEMMGIHLQSRTLHIILPVGISFYTFQTLSYTIDIYRRNLEPTRDPIAFFAFVSFFPQLVAGPIERAKDLLPQFLRPREFSHTLAVDGLRQILWGLFKKVVIADNVGLLVNEIFADAPHLSGVELWWGAVLFAVQIYGDFSGYSDIAIGTAKLLGFRLSLNFDYPYFSKNVTEFWRRWHISLSTWFRDYLFTPLALHWRNWETRGVVLALLLTFGLIGLWHGANWNFVIFGLLHGVILAYELLSKKRRKRWRKAFSTALYDGASMGLTFLVWCWTLVFFRASDLDQATTYVAGMGNLSMPQNFHLFAPEVIFLVAVLFAVDFLFQKKDHPFDLGFLPRPARWGLYLIMGFTVLNYLHYKQEFIYFQF